MKFAVIDVETPNRYNNSICSIGIAFIENDKIVDTFYSLVNPCADFDYYNTSIHGIYEADILNAPKFDEVWSVLTKRLEGSIITAHNAKFDLTVLYKDLQRYGIDFPNCDYICTYQLSKKYINDIDNHKLNTVSDYLGIKLENHHNALDDCLASAEILLAIKNKYNLDLSNEIQTYIKNSAIHTKTKYSNETLALRELQIIIKDILEDGVVDKDEFNFLSDWIFKHSELSGNYPFDRIYYTLNTIIECDAFDNDTFQELFNSLNEYINPINSRSCGCISLENSVVCLSGNFNHGTKSEIEQIIINQGGTIANTVTKKVDYVIVGNLGNIHWANDTYGTKVKKALELQEKGSNIKIVDETELFNQLCCEV